MTSCKQCGLQVNWVREGKRVQCHNPDGSDHWDLCSKTRMDRIKATGTAFERQRGKAIERGFSSPQYGEKLVAISFPSEKGKDYARLCAQMCNPRCGALPWEACACTLRLKSHNSVNVPGGI